MHDSLSSPPLIIPAAGLGSRLFPATWGIPKELFPLGNKPAIHYILEEAKNALINNILCITSPHKESLVRYLKYTHKQQEVTLLPEEQYRLNCLDEINSFMHYKFFTQQKALGVGNALYQAVKDINSHDYFAMAYPDDIIIDKNHGLAQLLNIHKLYECSVVAIQKIPADKVHLYGMIDGKNLQENSLFKINNIIEKPTLNETPSFYGIVGRYILSTKIFEFLSQDPKKCFMSALLKLISSNHLVLGIVIEENMRLDIGTTTGWIEAVNKINDTSNIIHKINPLFLDQKNIIEQIQK